MVHANSFLWWKGVIKPSRQASYFKVLPVLSSFLTSRHSPCFLHCFMRESVDFLYISISHKPNHKWAHSPTFANGSGFSSLMFYRKKKSFETLLWPGTHSTVTEDKNFSSKKRRWKITFFFDTLYLRSFSSRTWLTLLSIHIVWSLFWISCYAQEVFTLSFINSSKN